MKTLKQALWGAVWTGQLALGTGCALRWFRLPFAPLYEYIDLADLAPIAIMLALALLARSRLKVAALILWTVLALFAVGAAIATFPNWGDGILDAPPEVKARFESISAASEALMHFAALVLSVTGLALLKLEVASRPARIAT